MDPLSDTTEHPLVKALQDKINAVNGGPATLASKVDAFAKQANIGSYSWSLGVAQVNKVFAAIGSLICDNTPAQAAKLPAEWKAPAAGSAFYTLTLSPGFDIPVFLAPLDQEDQEGRIGHCLGLQFPSENGPIISNSALGLVITIGIKGEPHPLGSYVVGCRHFVCYAPKKRLQTNPLSAVTVCDTDCASCDVANCPTEPNKSAYKSLTASISRGNGDKINQLPDPANKCKEPHNIMKPGADLIWNKEDPDKPSKRPDVLLIPIQDAGGVVPIELEKAKAGWLKLFDYAPGSVRNAAKPFFDRIDKTADKFGNPINPASLEALLAKGTVYVCAKMPYSGYVVGTITGPTTKDYIEITPIQLATPADAEGVENPTKWKKISRSGDCGTAWFALVADDKSEKIALRLMGYHRGAKLKDPYQAIVVPLPAMWNEICTKLLPKVFPLKEGQSYSYQFGSVFA